MTHTTLLLHVLSTLRLLVPCLVAALFSACSGLQTTAAPDATPPQTDQLPTVVRGPIAGVAGLDVSGSYGTFETARTQLLAVLRAARAGESWQVREISARSYADDASIVVLRMPLRREVAANPWDRRAKQRIRQANEARLKPVQDALAGLEAFSPEKLPRAVRRRTDIYGFLAKAADVLGRAPATTRKVVVLASDLEDTAVQGRVNMDLNAAEVFVIAFESGVDVTATQRLRKHWIGELQRLGAGTLTFLDPHDDLSTVLSTIR